MRLDTTLNLLLAGICALVGCPPAARAAVEEAIEYRFVDAPPAAAETAVAWNRPATGWPPAAPRRYAAATSWRVDWSLFALPRADGGCAATNVRTHLAVTIRLPRLNPPDTLAQPHLDRLRQHEVGHLRIAQAAARRVDDDLLALAPMADCRALHEEATRRAAAHVDRLQHDQAAYDVLTEHGRRQHDLQSAVPP